MPSKTKSKPAKPDPADLAEQFGHLLNLMGPMPDYLARQLLDIKTTKEDEARLSDLLARQGEGGMGAAEVKELDARVRAGQWMTLLQTLARTALGEGTPRMVARA